MAREHTIISICMQPRLLRRIERFRNAVMRRHGFLSRSTAIRFLLSHGLEAVGKDGRADDQPASGADTRA